ncbi:MAG: hypothetical protein ACRD0C_19840 [Acidimicrobiia bacterium]
MFHLSTGAGRRLVALTFAGGTLALLCASPASATVTGGCQGSGTINGTLYDAAALDPATPITIPDEADVNYAGSVPLPPGTTDRTHSGKVDLQLPLGGSVTVADWGGSSKEVSAAGVHHYSIPSVVPRGITVRADATHNHAGLSAPCTGAFSIKLEGGPLDSPLPTAAAAGGTIISGAALAKAAFPKGGKP